MDLRTTIATLLPTPIVSDSLSGVLDPIGRRERTGRDPQLRDIAHLLPTPTASMHNDGEDAAHWEERRSRLAEKHGNNGAGTPLAVAVQTLDWGKYADAVTRAEVVAGRRSPEPTQPAKDGKRRLSSAFGEWMMLLPVGRVTGHGLTRRQELARVGNGVVPLQAAYALVVLLGRAAAHVSRRHS